MTNSRTKNYLTPKETAAYLKVSTETVRQWAKTGQLKAETTLGGHRRFNVEEVEQFVETLQSKKRIRNNNLRVLIIDNDNQYMNSVKELLESSSENIVIDKAHDGFEAGHKIVVFKPSVVLLDLMMPGINGLEVCRYLKGDDQTKRIRIIATTRSASQINTGNLIDAGAEAVLEKPIDECTLKEYVLAHSTISVGVT